MGKAPPGKYPQVRTITDSERIRMVQEIFSTITGRYDFLNRFLSLRRDVYWRKFAAAKMTFFRTHRYLDVACGTGDLSVAAARRHPHITVTGVDFVEAMVNAARRKVEREKLADRITLLQGDALCLPFDDASFDVTGIAFGIRNIPDRSRALSEMLRVTAPGGQVMILEMTFVRNRLFKASTPVFKPPAARFRKSVFENPAAYYYLADSIMNFPAPDEFSKILEQAGLVDVEKFPLTFGIAWLHVGKRAN
jgi:demethylmenaquinone methyltransferase/2-methoxy-6-polyprenyl-1,4-benzoquinol methylase